MLDMELQDLTFALLVFGLYLFIFIITNFLLGYIHFPGGIHSDNSD
jgi:hypothetical protein